MSTKWWSNFAFAFGFGAGLEWAYLVGWLGALIWFGLLVLLVVIHTAYAIGTRKAKAA